MRVWNNLLLLLFSDLCQCPGGGGRRPNILTRAPMTTEEAGPGCSETRYSFRDSTRNQREQHHNSGKPQSHQENKQLHEKRGKSKKETYQRKDACQVQKMDGHQMRRRTQVIPSPSSKETMFSGLLQRSQSVKEEIKGKAEAMKLRHQGQPSTSQMPRTRSKSVGSRQQLALREVSLGSKSLHMVTLGQKMKSVAPLAVQQKSGYIPKPTQTKGQRIKQLKMISDVHLSEGSVSKHKLTTAQIKKSYDELQLALKRKKGHSKGKRRKLSQELPQPSGAASSEADLEPPKQTRQRKYYTRSEGSKKDSQ